jgi:hypothetical protein
MFELLARALCREPGAWQGVLDDDSPATVLELVELGRKDT